jgi:hypothetical protein
MVANDDYVCVAFFGQGTQTEGEGSVQLTSS